jgi:3-phenylpropionate/cinnamic acid dioxygenase small subunit
MDAADWAGVGELFAAGELAAPDESVVAAGADGVAAMYAGGTVLYDGSPRTRHITANPIIEVDGDTATVRSSFVVLQGVDALALQPIISGRYRDTFRCTDGQWHFARRQFFVDQVGDLSRHLNYSIDV